MGNGRVGAGVTPVAAGVHSLILILTAPMTYGRGPNSARVILLFGYKREGEKKEHLFVSPFLNPFVTVNHFLVSSLFEECSLMSSAFGPPYLRKLYAEQHTEIMHLEYACRYMC